MAIKEISAGLTLEAYLLSKASSKFEWWHNDCVTFALQWVKIHTGRDILAALPRWSNEKEAQETIEKLGGFREAFNARFVAIDPDQAKDGDIAMIARTCFIFCGDFIVGPDFHGLTFIERSRAKCAWSC